MFKTSGITTAGSLYSFGIVVPLMYFVQRMMTLGKPFQRIKRCLAVFPREPLSCVLVSINVASCRRTECSCVLHDANKNQPVAIVIRYLQTYKASWFVTLSCLFKIYSMFKICCCCCVLFLLRDFFMLKQSFTIRHWTWCDVDLRIQIVTSAPPRSILVFSGHHNIMSNA